MKDVDGREIGPLSGLTPVGDIVRKIEFHVREAIIDFDVLMSVHGATMSDDETVALEAHLSTLESIADDLRLHARQQSQFFADVVRARAALELHRRDEGNAS